MRVDKAKFQKWLQAQDPNREFERRHNCDCPIAQYLRDTKEAKLAKVGTYTVTLLGPGSVKHLQLPGWAVHFIQQFDITGRAKSTARCALKILEELA
jgi:hypothetical protein